MRFRIFTSFSVCGNLLSNATSTQLTIAGNDHDEDSDKEPEPPVKVIDKTPARNTKRNAPAEAPASKAGAAPAGGARRGGYAGNEGGMYTNSS